MVLTTIRKRDGRIVSYEESKIANAIFKAFRAVGEPDEGNAKSLAAESTKQIEEKFGERIPSVEEVQDIVERIIIKNGHIHVAKAYIIYRKKHSEVRNLKYMFDYIDIVDSYLKNKNWMIKENSNMTYSLQGLNFYLSSRLVSRYWRDRLYSKEVSAAHTLGDLHIHNLSVFGAYCVGWDMSGLLKNGFTGVKGKVQSKAANHFQTAMNQVVNFFYTLQGESAGAQSFSNFDTYLAPFIRQDKLSYEQVKQTMQEFLYNMNIPTRVGFQTPFTNISFDLKAPDYMKDKKVIVGGIEREETYGDYQEEIDIFNKAFYETMAKGDAKGRPFTFPIPTYNITKDFDFEDPKYKGLWELAAKYGTPYFSNYINSDTTPEKVRELSCRTSSDDNKLIKKGGGFFGAEPLTGSIGLVTINMPRLGYLSKDETVYFERLNAMMDLAKEALETKRKIIEKFIANHLYPYSKFYLEDTKQTCGSYWANHFSTIGLIGMNESLINFMGEGIYTEEGNKFAIKVLDFMRKKIEEYQEETGNRYNLEASPAESTGHRLALMDKEKYPEIIVANEDDPNKGKGTFYTNSTNLPVDYTNNIDSVLGLQNELQSKYTGGTVFHTFLNKSPNPDKVKELVKNVLTNYKIPNLTVTPTFSVCPKHGYLEGNTETCPECQSTCEVYSRVVGYLRPTSQWNVGKKQEFLLRKTYDESL